MAIDKSHILYLFERPTEPMYVPKGEKKVTFKLRPEYYPPGYEGRKNEIIWHDKPGIPVQEITLPDLELVMQLGRNESFSIFAPAQQGVIKELISIFLNTSSYEDLLSVALYCRDRVNPELFIYALSVAMVNHTETQDVALPSLMRSFPGKFVGGKALAAAGREASSFPSHHRKPIEIPKDFTASDLDEEHRIAYWREDFGINLHHWHWHVVYPNNNVPNKVINKDRRGELFAYMHKQILARYNCERLCNQLEQVKPYIHWREPIHEPYFPKLDTTISSQNWAPRTSGAILQDTHRDHDYPFYIHDMEIWRDRIFDAIRIGSVIDTKGKSVPLTEKDGINVLGNMVESSKLSINRSLYGNLHNMGHYTISACHDPDSRYLEPYGVMSDTTTAMRDPIFYRWHAFINTIFQEYKYSLPPYDQQQLDFIGIEIEDISVTTQNQLNVLNTFWSRSMVDVSGGLDFRASDTTSVIFTHLNHDSFTYKIVVNNHDSASKVGTVRIFIAPHYDERGLCFQLIQKMQLMIEMDKFSVTLPPGKSTLTRNSKDSSVTIPFHQIFPPDSKNEHLPTNEDFCKCGWPAHMLVPKGTPNGFPMDLFIMISDFKADVVPLEEITPCKAASSYCGLRNKKYPDARPMGYPFDRRPPGSVNSLDKFLTKNMKVTKISVKFTDIAPPQKCPVPKIESTGVRT